MSAIYLLIGIGLLIAGGFLVAFLWSVWQGQFDDDYTPAVRVLFGDEGLPGNSPLRPEKNGTSENNTTQL